MQASQSAPEDETGIVRQMSNAICVSSTTESGIETLKAALLEVLHGQAIQRD